MALSFNGNSPRKITYNNSNVSKLIYNGNVVWKGLPSAYQEVEYLETQGLQHVEIDYICNNKTRLYFEFRTPSAIPTNKSTVLFYTGSGSTNFGYALSSTGASGKSRAFYRGTYTGDYLDTETDYVLDFNKNKLYLNNVLLHTFNENTFTVDFKLPIFAQYYNNTTPVGRAPSGTRIYYAKIYDNGTLTCELVPCYRKSDNKPGFFDVINEDFYINLGTDDFIVGSNVR